MTRSWDPSLNKLVAARTAKPSGWVQFFPWTVNGSQVDFRIDYRCADGRFLMSPRGVAVSNTRYLSSSETKVNAGIRGWKLLLSESTLCQESVGGVKSSFSTGPDIFKPLLKCSIFKRISWLNGSFFGSEHRSNGANVASQLANFFLSARL